MRYGTEDSDDYDGVRYDSEHDEGHLDQFRTEEEDERAYRRLLSRARALGLPTYAP